MYRTKLDQNEKIDSGLGDSFGPSGPVESVVNQVESLDVSNTNETDHEIEETKQKVLKVLRTAFTPDEDHDTYLHLYIAQGEKDKTMQLIEICPQTNLLDIQNNIGQTALHIATYVNFDQVVSKLMHHGAGIEYVDKDGRNVLHLCAERGHVATLEAIVRTACQTQQVDKVQTLLNERDFAGLTPFFLAVSNKHEELCKRLVDLKVDVNLTDSKTGNSPLHEAIIEPDCSDNFIKFLIQKCNVNVNAQNYAGVTALHCAAGRGNAKLFSTLIQCGADAETKDLYGYTAQAYGSVEIQQICQSPC